MQIFPEIATDGSKMIYPQGTGYYQPLYDVGNPLHVAVRWKNIGARWLHIEAHTTEISPSNLRNLIQQLTSMGLGIQVNTQLTDATKIDHLFKVGASRVFLPATISPQSIAELLAKYGAEAIGLAFNTESNQPANLALGKELYKKGLRYALCTDIARVGTLGGLDLPRLNDFAIKTQLDLISKGGVAHMSDLIKLKSTRQVAGVVIGRVLYDGRIQLAEALALTK